MHVCAQRDDWFCAGGLGASLSHESDKLSVVDLPADVCVCVRVCVCVCVFVCVIEKRETKREMFGLH